MKCRGCSKCESRSCRLWQWAPMLTGQYSFMGFCQQVNQCTNIDPHSDPQNPEQIRKNNWEFLEKSQHASPKHKDPCAKVWSWINKNSVRNNPRHRIIKVSRSIQNMSFEWRVKASHVGWNPFNASLRAVCPAQQIRGINPMLTLCRVTVYDGGPTLKQHWVNVSCLLVRLGRHINRLNARFDH